MRVILYIIIILLMLAAPVTPLDVAKLQPVQTVALYVHKDAVYLETDTGITGRGANVQDALDDLEKATPGVIYLDTAEYLLITEQSAHLVCEIQQYLHPDVKVSMWDKKGAVEDASKHLGVRNDLPELSQWKNAEEKS